MSGPVSRVLLKMVIYLALPSPTSSARPTRKLSGPPHSFLFGLASDGVYMCPSCYQQGGSLLHCHFTLTLSGGIFLLHWSWDRSRQTLSGILPCEARTFLTLTKVSGATIQPTHKIILNTLGSICNPNIVVNTLVFYLTLIFRM